MIRFLVFLLMFPLLAYTQQKQSPYVTFRDGKILYFIPRSEPRMLPVVKPDFVEVYETATHGTKSFTQTDKELRERLAAFSNRNLSDSDKEDFLASLACLILLNCNGPNNIDAAFISKAKAMEEDNIVGNDARLVVRLFGDFFNLRKQGKVKGF